MSGVISQFVCLFPYEAKYVFIQEQLKLCNITKMCLPKGTKTNSNGPGPTWWVWGWGEEEEEA